MAHTQLFMGLGRRQIIYQATIIHQDTSSGAFSITNIYYIEINKNNNNIEDFKSERILGVLC